MPLSVLPGTDSIFIEDPLLSWTLLQPDVLSIVSMIDVGVGVGVGSVGVCVGVAVGGGVGVDVGISGDVCIAVAVGVCVGVVICGVGVGVGLGVTGGKVISYLIISAPFDILKARLKTSAP